VGRLVMTLFSAGLGGEGGPITQERRLVRTKKNGGRCTLLNRIFF